jgi:acetyltransferase-like isoleucine patch superfamily enzyme
MLEKSPFQRVAIMPTDILAPEASLRLEANMGQNNDGLEAALNNIITQMLATLQDRLDHPEIWRVLADVCAADADMADAMLGRIPTTGVESQVLQCVLCSFSQRFAQPAEAIHAAIRLLEALMARHSQSPQVQGALFYCQSRLDPTHPKYQLAGKICPLPFVELDVLDASAHLCCASWLPTSIGNLHQQDWLEAWNSDAAQNIRASIIDSTYRHCNKVSCPVIQNNDLIPVGELEGGSSDGHLHMGGAFEYLGVKDQPIPIARGWLTPVRNEGPAILNLSYDKTCNLACPSCRSEKYAADSAERERISVLQDRNIKPLLSQAHLAMITGSGDPFASKTFRHLLEWIDAEKAPALEIKLMTNGLLLDAREWERFGGIHDKVIEIKVSIDGITKRSHEALRLGSDWDRMLPNLHFMGSLAQANPRLSFILAFIVQRDNFAEMGAAVDFAHRVGATALQFARLTNWGTYSDIAYHQRAVFLSDHPQHRQFLHELDDPRLDDPIVSLGDLASLRRAAVQEVLAPDIPVGPNPVGPDPDALFPVAGDRRVCFIKNAIRNPNVIVGDYTYYDDPEPPEEFETRNVLYHYPFIGDKLVIGKFCSIAHGVRFIMNGANHSTENASNYLFPFFGHGWEHIGADHQADAYSRGDTLVGNDVWFGYEAMVMPGVTIGDGAVIGARAVVTRDVAPYAIVAGNPAREIRRRFDEATIARLQASQWWNWSPERIAAELPRLISR